MAKYKIISNINEENVIIKEYISLQLSELVVLYELEGWGNYTKNIDLLIKAYANSLCIITAYHNQQLVGICRCVGDGYFVVFIQDIIVKEEFRRNGIGKKLVEYVFEKYKKVRQKILLRFTKHRTRDIIIQ